MSGKRAATAVLLAGGQSTRMGTDKARLPWGETTLLQHIHAQLCAQFDEVLLASGTPDRYTDLGLPGIADSPLAQGPMAGILAGLEAARHDLVYLHPCDTPEVSPALLDALFAALDTDHDAALPMDPGAVYPHPIPGLYRRATRGAFHSTAETGQFAISAAANTLKIAITHNTTPLHNLNTPGDLKPLS